MSEYQYYEFLAVDRPLTDEQQAAVRELSTRAQITATSFTNEYHWGGFKGSPEDLVREFYDLHLYYANWGSRRLLLKLPADAFQGVNLDEYVVGDRMDAHESGKDVILDLGSEDEEQWEEDFQEWTLGSFAALRAELLGGDLRPLYLVFLAAIGVWAYDEDAFDYADGDILEPPVPAGLGELTGAQRTLADFLRLDGDLLAEAADVSPPRGAVVGQRDAREWVAELPTTTKDDAIIALLAGDHATAQAKLQRRFRDAAGDGVEASRTIGELLDNAAKRKQARASR